MRPLKINQFCIRIIILFVIEKRFMLKIKHLAIKSPVSFPTTAEVTRGSSSTTSLFLSMQPNVGDLFYTTLLMQS